MSSDHTLNRVSIYPFDWVVIGYCLLMTFLISLLGRPLGAYVDELAFYLGAAALALLTVRYVDENRSRLHALARLLYPALLFTFFYRATGGLMFLVTDQFYDWQLVTFEKMILGTNPTLYIDANLLGVWVNEVLSFCYLSYYLMLPAFLIPVFIKKDYRVIRQFLTAACLTFFVSYLLFSLYPVEGPRWHLAMHYLNDIEGPVFRPLVTFVIEKAAVHGGAMPSSHTGIAVVIMIFCFRYYRLAGWLILPATIGLAMGTVWGRFHYVSDVFVGTVIGVFAVMLVWRYYDGAVTDRYDSRTQKKLSTQHVS